MSRWGIPLSERLELKTFPVTECGCHIWMGGRNKSGYGVIKINGVCVTTHRASWMVNCGEIPDDLHVLHRCDVRSCINPDHLFLGSPADNAHDMGMKKRSPYGEGHHKTRLSASEIAEIKASSAKTQELANKFGLTYGGAYQIRKNKRWKYQ